MSDPAWTAFRLALTREMSAPPKVTSAALAQRMGPKYSEDLVNNWRRGRSRPDLAELGEIVKQVNAEKPSAERSQWTLYSLLREMEILPPEPTDEELFTKAFRLQNLQQKLDAAVDETAELGRRSGALTIVREAVSGGRWAVGVWPAYEGPDQDTVIHVADRLDFRPLGANQMRPWDDLGMRAALRATHAVRSDGTPRWDGALDSENRWSIVHVGSPRASTVESPWPGLNGLCFLAPSIEGWVNDVAALTSFAIGYGLTTTRDLALDYQESPEKSRSQPQDRWLSHRQLLSDPPRRRAWSHFGQLLDVAEHNAMVIEAAARGVVFVIITETDECLDKARDPARWPAGLKDFAHLVETREALKSLANDLTDIRPESVIHLKAEAFEKRSDRWRQVLQHTLDTLNGLRQRNVYFPPADLRRIIERNTARNPSIAIPVYKWLGERGWPDHERL